ncbi:Sister chromatid cohesion 1 protein 3 [Sesamum angolense]|uniref:Sister chromatid cohesion 1 protein 3 n=1 Tax=Sesamum angolense TaxID=2727404 RepID=A0AAE1WRX6_9LAMI|nr:Sister chromatid cohesion 1 protein 3 [Sesamum angolense]
MYPDVPISQRTSANLLLGAARVFSKQVDYVLEDAQNAIKRVNANLHDDATHAPFHAITLPEKFELDSLELDDYDKDSYVFAEYLLTFSLLAIEGTWINPGVHVFRCEDSHLKSKEDITLSEQIPTGENQYIVIRVDEHDFMASSFIEDNSGSGPMPMEEDIPPPVEVDAAAGSEYPPPNQLGANDGNIGNSTTPQDLPSIEIMRDAKHGFDFKNSPILPDRADPDKFLEEQINTDNATCSPVTERVLLPDDRFSSPQNHEEQHSLRHLDSPMLLDLCRQFPEMEIQPTPRVARPRARNTKRKQYFDKSPVLSNKRVKKALGDASDTCRSRRNCPLSSLAIFTQNMRLQLKKSCLPLQSYITGCCPVLSSLYDDHPNATEKMPQETRVDQPPSRSRDFDRETEVLRNNEGASVDRFMPSFSTAVPSPHGRSCFTPVNSNLGLQSKRLKTTEGDGVLPTADLGTSPRNLDSEMRTPDTFYQKSLLAEHTTLPGIPKLVSCTRSQGIPEFSIFSNNQGTVERLERPSRTRTLAQYLKEVTPTSGNSEESSGYLNLSKILEGKSRKICARMFNETLNLKANGFIDVHQENPYDDIRLKLIPKLSKGQFSG